MSKTQPPERIDPRLESQGIVAHHLAKYRFVDAQIGDGQILEVGCGLGYGTATLGRSGRTITAVDVDADSVATAIERYANGGITFARMDGEHLEFPDGAFDAVVCLEAIEHFHDPLAHLREVARVLKLTGVYVVSTPQPGVGGHPENNPHHHREYTYDLLRKELSEAFNDVTILGQHRRQSSGHRAAQRADLLGIRKINTLRPLMRIASRMLGTRATEDAEIGDFLIDADGARDGTEFVAVCRSPKRT